MAYVLKPMLLAYVVPGQSSYFWGEFSTEFSTNTWKILSTNTWKKQQRRKHTATVVIARKDRAWSKTKAQFTLLQPAWMSCKTSITLSTWFTTLSHMWLCKLPS